MQGEKTYLLNIKMIDFLLDYMHAGEIERDNAVQDETHKGRERAWKRWMSWMGDVGLDGDPYLIGFSRPQKARLV